MVVVARLAASTYGRATHPSHRNSHAFSSHSHSAFQVLALEARLLEDLRCVLEDCDLSRSLIDPMLNGTPPSPSGSGGRHDVLSRVAAPCALLALKAPKAGASWEGIGTPV